MSCIDKYNLSKKYKERMKDFFTFRIQTKDIKTFNSKFSQAYFNLLLHGDELDVLLNFNNSILDALNIPADKVHTLTGYEVKKLSDSSAMDSRLRNYSHLMLVVSSSGKFDTGIRVEDAESFDDMMSIVCYYIKENPEKTVVLAVDENTFREVVRANHEVYYRVFGHHIKLEELKEKDIYDCCIKKIESSKFTMNNAFKEELKTYIEAIYQEADLKGYEFVEDLFNRLQSNYFCKIRANEIYELEPDCIPRYKNSIRDVNDILSELDDLVGMKTVRRQLEKICHRIDLNATDMTKNPLHMVFTGNPGTGKTTVAERIAEMLFSMGAIKKRKPVIAKASSILSISVNGSRLKTEELMKKALGGVLFLDEAYSLVDKNDRGVVTALVDGLERYSDQLVVILAGYENEMKNFLKTNPGLKDRFKTIINFPDYSIDELTEIFSRMCRKEGYVLDDSAINAYKKTISGKMPQVGFANARTVRNVFNEVVDNWCDEAYKAKQNGVDIEKKLTEKNFESIIPEKREISLDNIIGLDKLKESIEDFKEVALFQQGREKLGLETGENKLNYHMVFTGNPGTGKTMVANIMADILYNIGILKTNKLTVLERKDLVGRYLGETEKVTNVALMEGRGGVIFIDEAYSLATGGNDSRDYGNRVIEQLITFMVENQKDTVVIFAGYKDEMKDFVDSNPGIKSRIGFFFHFEDYSRESLVKIFIKKCENNGFKINEAAKKKVAKVIEYFMPMKNFGNGRFIDRLYEMTYRNRAKRKGSGDKDKKRYDDITVKDIPNYKDIISIQADSDEMYDPDELNAESNRRTVIHELGHAVAMCSEGEIPESISSNNQIGSLGRVKIGKQGGNMTEEKCKARLVTLLSGRNAERVILGSNSAGCSSDYERTKILAKDMIEKYAMGEIGVTKAEDFIKEADTKSSNIMMKYKYFIIEMTDELKKKGEISGEEFYKKFKEFDPEKKKNNSNRIKK